MNPNWKDGSEARKKSVAMADDKSVTTGTIGGRHVRREMFLKSEVGYEHPAQGEDECGGCKHFKSPHSCEIVAGYIRRADWCRKYEEKT